MADILRADADASFFTLNKETFVKGTLQNYFSSAAHHRMAPISPVRSGATLQLRREILWNPKQPSPKEEPLLSILSKEGMRSDKIRTPSPIEPPRFGDNP